MKKIRLILLFSVSFIMLLAGFILHQIKTNTSPTYLVCAIPVPMFCGTPNLTENQEKGREIFNSNCAACHKKYAKSTGPALQNVDSLVVVKWLRNRKNKIDSTKIEEYGIDYHRITFSKVLNKKEIIDLIEYCNN
ncbi:cytochrome c [Flavobacterium sp. AC]|uniref:Cytochrome c n=1 Tax=Flavobacterium azizsancarii TaxID=2961580 RepID=A0ABT4W6D5_9FLAO|nr:cytochrome c [Flavobacterium azizsancarii]MDA6068144.1 cytochrome c [Flavobacterium azizsancarii]